MTTKLSKSGTYLVGLRLNAWLHQGKVHFTTQGEDPAFPRGLNFTLVNGTAAEQHVRRAIANLREERDRAQLAEAALSETEGQS